MDKTRFFFTFFLIFFIFGCATNDIRERYKTPAYVDIKDKNECAERAAKVATRAYNNSISGKSTTINADDFDSIMIPIAIGGVTSFIFIPVTIPRSSGSLSAMNTAHKEYMKGCLRKKGYKLD